MQQHATQAYQTVAKRTGNPRDLEANLLSKSATNLQRIRVQMPSGSNGRMKVCTRCIKSGKIVKAA